MNTFDLIMLAVIIIIAIIGYVRGAVKTILSVVGGILSYVLAYVLGKGLAQPVYIAFFEESINEKISLQINDMLENGSSSIGDSITELLPDSLQFFVSDTELIESLNSVVGDTTAQIIENSTQIINQVIEPVFIGLLAVCITIVLFIIFNLIVTLLLRMSNFINDIPVVGKANRTTGAILGFLFGVGLTFAIVTVCTLFIPVSSENSEFDSSIKEQSFFFKIFSNDDIAYNISEEFFVTEPYIEEGINQ